MPSMHSALSLGDIVLIMAHPSPEDEDAHTALLSKCDVQFGSDAMPVRSRFGHVEAAMLALEVQ
jgi:hypothetical protein